MRIPFILMIAKSPGGFDAAEELIQRKQVDSVIENPANETIRAVLQVCGQTTLLALNDLNAGRTDDPGFGMWTSKKS